MGTVCTDNTTRMRNRLSAALEYSRAKTNSPHSVYVLRCHRYFKIGFAANPQSRIADMQVGNPLQIHLVALIPTTKPVSLERELHRRFGHYHHRGEWFTLPQHEIDWLLSQGNSLALQIAHQRDTAPEPTRVPQPDTHAVHWPTQDPPCLHAAD